MPRIKERWRGLSKKWKLVILALPAMAILGVGGTTIAAGTLYSAGNPFACGKCHIMQPYVDSYYKSSFIDSIHASSERDVKCNNCHRTTLVQQTKQLIAFVIRSYETPLKQDVQAQNFCTDCHLVEEVTGAVRSKPEFAENSLLSYHLTVEARKNEGCEDPRAELVRCQDCHRAHRAGVNYCATCHSVSFIAPNK